VTTTQTLLPNGTRSGAGDFTVTGAGSIHAALNDSSDSTTVLRTSTTDTKSLVVNCGTYTLGASERVQSVRVAVRMARGGNQSKVYVRLGYVTDAAAGTIRYAAADQYTGSSTIGWVNGAYRTTAPDGQDWDQSRLNELVVKVTDYSPTSGGRTTFYEVKVEVEVNARPTLTVGSPTGTVADTSRPAIGWTYSDADGDAQTVYETRVFTAAQYGAAGFDPATSSAVWESGVVSSSDPGVTPGVDLEDGVTHRAYVRAGHAIGSGSYLSDWAFSTFTVDYEAPPAPDLSTAFQALYNRVTLTAVGHTNYLTVDDATFDATAGTWAAISGCSVARSTAFALSGSSSLAITATAAGTMSARSGLYAIPTDGQQVAARADFRPDGSARTVRMLLRWFNAASTLLSTSTGSNVTETGAAWTSASIAATPPAGATQVQVGVEIVSAASAEVHYIDKVSLHNGSTAYWSPGGLYDAQTIFLERSTDDGVTWETLDEVDAGTATQTAALDDYAAERDQTNIYRARVIGRNGQTAVASPYSANGAAWVPNDEKWWIKAPGDASLNVGGARVLGGSAIQQTREAAQGVFRPLGRDRAVVVTGEVYGYDGTYDVLAVGDAEWATLEALLLDYTGDLVVQSPFGETRTVRVVSRSVAIEGTPTLPRRIVSVAYVEV
jgi:hypothetical protein